MGWTLVSLQKMSVPNRAGTRTVATFILTSLPIAPPLNLRVLNSLIAMIGKVIPMSSPAPLIVAVLPLFRNRTQCVSKLGHLGCTISQQPSLISPPLRNASLSVSIVMTVLPSLGIEYLMSLPANFVSFFQQLERPQMSVLIVFRVQSPAPALMVLLAVLMISTLLTS